MYFFCECVPTCENVDTIKIIQRVGIYHILCVCVCVFFSLLGNVMFREIEDPETKTIREQMVLIDFGGSKNYKNEC